MNFVLHCLEMLLPEPSDSATGLAAFASLPVAADGEPRAGVRDCTAAYCGCGEFRANPGNRWMCLCGHAYADHN